MRLPQGRTVTFDSFTSKHPQRRSIPFTAIVLVQYLAEHRVFLCDVLKQRHTGAEFQIVRIPHDAFTFTLSRQELPDYATAYADGRLTFTFKNGSTFEG